MDRWVIQQNMLRFREMLLRETDSARRHGIGRLLAQEEENRQCLCKRRSKNSSRNVAERVGLTE